MALAVETSILIPTFRREDRLRLAISSVIRQKPQLLAHAEILIIDNDPAGSAAWVEREFGGAFPVLRYIHEPRSGVAHARNRGVAEARGATIVFIDDDETAAPGWLEGLLTVLARTEVDAVFGPVLPVFDSPAPPLADLAIAIFERKIEAEEGALITHLHARLGTGNSAYRRERCLESAEPFAPALGHTGGEDTVFLRGLVRAGRRFAWARSAQVEEHVPGDRATAPALARRRFRQGQLRAAACVEGGRADIPGLVFWMAAGFSQGAAHALQSLAFGLTGNQRAAEAARIKAAGGWGKLLWMRESPLVYGGGG